MNDKEKVYSANEMINDISCFDLLLQSPEVREKFLSSDFIVELVCKLEQCRSCTYLQGYTGEKCCNGSCYLETMGIPLDTPSTLGTAELLGMVCSYLLTMAEKNENLGAREKAAKDRDRELRDKELDLDDKEVRVQERISKLKENEAEFEAKKAKLGRPSDFENRRLKYEVLWVQANPRPSYEELRHCFNPVISLRQVKRDIARIKQELGEPADDL